MDCSTYKCRNVEMCFHTQIFLFFLIAETHSRESKLTDIQAMNFKARVSATLSDQEQTM